jgi:hypothetical protein
MIHLTPLRELTLTTLSQREPSFLSAASGLVAIGSHLYVVADDELQLGRFPADGDAPGELLRLRPGVLPDYTPNAKQASRTSRCYWAAAVRRSRTATLAMGSVYAEPFRRCADLGRQQRHRHRHAARDRSRRHLSRHRTAVSYAQHRRRGDRR